MRSLLPARIENLVRRSLAGRRRASLRVVAVSARNCRATLILGEQSFPCILGRGGVTALKREGDGATPAGAFALGAVLYRPDRLARPAACLARLRLSPKVGWCDDPRSLAYNRPISLPHAARHERLWRDDGIYDLIVVLAHNMCPALAGRGSAIFMHLIRPDREPTAGCIALARADLERLLVRLKPGIRLVAGSHINRPLPARAAGSRRS